MSIKQEEDYRKVLRVTGVVFGLCGLFLIVKSVMPTIDMPYEERTEDMEEQQQKLLMEAKELINKNK